MSKNYVGEKASYSVEITEDVVNSFAELSGDKNGIHICDKTAKKSIFGKRIVHGMLLASYISKVIGMDMPGKGTIYLSQELHFKRPVYLGNIVKVCVEIIEIDGNNYILHTYIECDKKIVVDGKAKVKVVED